MSEPEYHVRVHEDGSFCDPRAVPECDGEDKVLVDKERLVAAERRTAELELAAKAQR